MDARNLQDGKRPRHVVAELAHRVRPRQRITAAVAAHVEPQHAKAGGEQGRDLLGPHPAIGGERMGEADHGRCIGTDKVIGDASAVERQKHGTFPPNDRSA